MNSVDQPLAQRLFVSTYATKDVALPHVRGQTMDYATQNCIAGIMAKVIVDRLEVIQDNDAFGNDSCGNDRFRSSLTRSAVRRIPSPVSDFYSTKEKRRQPIGPPFSLLGATAVWPSRCRLPQQIRRQCSRLEYPSCTAFLFF